VIDKNSRSKIFNIVSDYWNIQSGSADFINLFGGGKEVGHRIADFVDEKTTAKLVSDPSIDARYERNKNNGFTEQKIDQTGLYFG
jgi:hypothetical protein